MTEKQNMIISAAASIFARYGYKKTTIDEIVETAGISKGLFYHYYPDKKTLYLQLYDYYTTIMTERVEQKIDLTVTDFFERLKQISHIRIDCINEYPNLWGFLYSAYYEQHPDVAPAVKEKNQKMMLESYSGSASNIDWSRLRPGITSEQAIQLVTWIAEGFVSKLNQDRLEFDSKLYEEFDHYLEMMKTGLY